MKCGIAFLASLLVSGTTCFGGIAPDSIDAPVTLDFSEYDELTEQQILGNTYTNLGFTLTYSQALVIWPKDGESGTAGMLIEGYDEGSDPYALSLEITNDEGKSFDLQSFAWAFASGTNSVKVEGFLDGTSTGIQYFDVATYGGTTLTLSDESFNYVDRVVISGNFFEVFDTFQINQATVPEPSAYAAALGLAAASFALVRRRRKKA